MSPAVVLASIIDAANERIGRAVSWLALLMVLMLFVIVLLRYVFGLGYIPMQESILFMHSSLSLIGAQLFSSVFRGLGGGDLVHGFLTSLPRSDSLCSTCAELHPPR